MSILCNKSIQIRVPRCPIQVSSSPRQLSHTTPFCRTRLIPSLPFYLYFKIRSPSHSLSPLIPSSPALIAYMLLVILGRIFPMISLPFCARFYFFGMYRHWTSFAQPRSVFDQ